jgi:hypothetical protein
LASLLKEIVGFEAYRAAELRLKNAKKPTPEIKKTRDDSFGTIE